MGIDENKRLVRRLVEEAVGNRNPDVLEQIAAGPFAEVARRWVAPFRGAFPDFTMEIVELIAEGDKVVAHFRCSGSQLGEWLGLPPTGRRGSRTSMRCTSLGFETGDWCPGSAWRTTWRD